MVELRNSINRLDVIPSVFSIFVIENQVYRIDNARYQIFGENENVVVSLEESKEKNLFFILENSLQKKYICLKGMGNFINI